jgi:hypothetical protein
MSQLKITCLHTQSFQTIFLEINKYLIADGTKEV